MKTLYLVRGVPGSGKSTYAKGLGLKHHYEADMYMEQNGGYIRSEDGSIKFNPSLLSKAHSWCQRMTFEAMKTGEDVVVSNTFRKKWEMIPYFDMAEKFGYNIIENTMVGEYPNVHGCPPEKVEQMRREFEP